MASAISRARALASRSPNGGPAKGISASMGRLQDRRPTASRAEGRRGPARGDARALPRRADRDAAPRRAPSQSWRGPRRAGSTAARLATLPPDRNKCSASRQTQPFSAPLAATTATASSKVLSARKGMNSKSTAIPYWPANRHRSAQRSASSDRSGSSPEHKSRLAPSSAPASSMWPSASPFLVWPRPTCSIARTEIPVSARRRRQARTRSSRARMGKAAPPGTAGAVRRLTDAKPASAASAISWGGGTSRKPSGARPNPGIIAASFAQPIV